MIIGAFLLWMYGPDFPAPARAPEPRAAALVARLGSDSFREREAAQHALARMGGGARLALEGARGSPDPEVRRRAGEVLAARPRTLDEEAGWWPQLDLLWYDDRGELLDWRMPWYLSAVRGWAEREYLLPAHAGPSSGDPELQWGRYGNACRRLAHDLHGRGVPRRVIVAIARRLQRREGAWAARYVGGCP
jgi:non-ribosomal peptide synthetase component F